MSFEKFNLTNKTALITGAGGILGKQHAAALLDAGAMVVLTDIDGSRLQNTIESLRFTFKRSKIFSQVMDVSKLDDVRHASDILKKDNLRIDILINNAAIDPKVNTANDSLSDTRLENFSVEAWERQISVGLTGAFICSQVFGSNMASDKKGGVILNIASDLSIISPDQRLYKIEGMRSEDQPVKPVTYSVIKSGLIGLTKYISTYWNEDGVRCNALSPGGVFNNQNKEFTEKIKKLIPLGRMANTDEYQAAVQFLCSDASSYMTGQNIIIDGGRSVW